MDFNVNDFSYRLMVLLEEKNLKQTDLAKKVGTSNVTICRYLSGERTPRVDVITRIASELGVSLDYLLGLSNNKTSDNIKLNNDLETAVFIKKFYSLDNNFKISKKQIEVTKNLLNANKDFIISTK